MRKAWIFMALAFIFVCFLWLTRSRAASLKVGAHAPDFALTDQNGHTIKLSDFLGRKNLVLAFYIKAFTSG